MTLIEVLFAIVILSGVMLAMSQFGSSFARATSNASELTAASDLAAARVEMVKAHGDYATLVSLFDGTSESSDDSTASPSMSAYSGYSRTTKVVRTYNDSLDFVTVTVTVTADVLDTPMTKSVIISAY